MGQHYVKRQKKRLVAAYQAGIAQMAASGQKAPSSFINGGSEQPTTFGVSNPAQVPFMITQAQKAALRAKGFDEDQIANMTPEKAHQLLGVIPPPPY